MAIFASVAYGDTAERRVNSVVRTTTQNTVARNDSITQKTVSRTSAKDNKNISPRSGQKNISTKSRAASARTNTSTQRVQTARSGRTISTARSATAATSRSTSAVRSATRPARAATTVIDSSTSFGAGYNACRDAYFTCMDQFCATANDSYRRCACSSKLEEIKSRERALSNAGIQIQDFRDLNIAAITKSAAEVNAMLNATTGESIAANARDTSNSAQTLAGISNVLSGTKKQALSTQGTLDIAGDINAIWATTDLVGGTNIANLTGEPLYNAVHAQCSELVADQCGSQSTLTMVVSAYGMYIENDCSAIINLLDKNLTSTNQDIRKTEREMQLARLENYDAHNSSAINECIANVRADITAPTACGTDYVHCLDITGLYLNKTTGAPIYSSNFYQLENQLSLSGDILTNQSNRLLVDEINRMRTYAANSLDKCRDIADEVWDEFVRQSITEIYQGQHEKIRTVKNECLEVVNKCYDEKNQSLKDFSNVKEQLLLGSRMELSEELCQEKLDACSNLYGGGTQGMSELLIAMRDITDQTIGQQCLATLRDYARDLCAIPSNDTLHSYPFGCRTYTPGEQRYAVYKQCNLATENIKKMQTTIGTINDGGHPLSIPNWSASTTNSPLQCNITYNSCKPGFYLSKSIEDSEPVSSGTTGAYCMECSKYPASNGSTCNCAGGTTPPHCEDDGTVVDNVNCGTNYIGSMYHKIARYAMQVCVRPSQSQENLPATVLQDINLIMDEIHVSMAESLSKECERLVGEWINTPWSDYDLNNKNDNTGHTKLKKFYDETSANDQWGFCSDPDIAIDKSEKVISINFGGSFFPNPDIGPGTNPDTDPDTNPGVNITPMPDTPNSNCTEATTTPGQVTGNINDLTKQPIMQCSKSTCQQGETAIFGGYYYGDTQIYNSDGKLSTNNLHKVISEKETTNLTLTPVWNCVSY